jgi:hypothetical protein
MSNSSFISLLKVMSVSATGKYSNCANISFVTHVYAPKQMYTQGIQSNFNEIYQVVTENDFIIKYLEITILILFRFRTYFQKMLRITRNIFFHDRICFITFHYATSTRNLRRKRGEILMPPSIK